MKKFIVKIAVKFLVAYIEQLNIEFKDGVSKEDFLEALKKIV